MEEEELNSYLLTEILQSESEFLEQEYLHLHEDDIGTDLGNYRLLHYIYKFIQVLPSFKDSLKSLVCCYSIEETSPLPPEKCKREKFFYYVINDFNWNNEKEFLNKFNQYSSRPKEVLINDPENGIVNLLQNIHLIQPYILYAKSGKHSEAYFETKVPTTNLILDCLDDFQNRGGGYQFSWYGFEFKDNEKEKWIKLKSLIETAFINHVLKWNFELKKAHENTLSLKSYARKSAISAAMSRNMSHNLGSHPIPQFNEKLEQLIKSNNGFDKIFLEKIISYNRHIQGRMEFHADFSGNVQSQIYVEYSFKKFIQEIKSSIESNEIIMKGLIDSYTGSKDLSLVMDSIEKDYNVDIRGDNLGVQAFYIIIENIIRNTYKHSNPKINNDGDNQLHLIIKISETQNAKLTNDYFCVDIFDVHGCTNKERNAQTLDKINSLIQQSVLDNKTNALRDEGWGLLEIKSAASYLIDYPLERFDDQLNQKFLKLGNNIYPYPIIVAHFFDNEGNIEEENLIYKNLGYRFYLPKPKLYLINDTLIFSIPEEELKKEGLEISNKRGGRHRFFITKNNYLEFINQRTVYFTDDSINELNSRKYNLFKENVWRKYLNDNYGTELFEKEIVNATDFSPKVISNTNSIVLDVHGRNISYLGKSSKDFSREDLFDNNNNLIFFYYEALPSANQITSDYENSFLEKSILLEAASVKVSIFDERIQESSQEKDYDNRNLVKRDISEASGIYIPNRSINLKKLVAEKEKELRDILYEELCKRVQMDEYIIVHQTLIEILSGKTSKEELKNWLNNFEHDHKLTQNKKVLVITSGRGRTSNLPDNVYYLNFTILNEYVIRNRSKVKLVNVLKLLRKM